MALLELRNVTRRFGNFVAVDNVSLSIDPGEFFTLLGPSGCGKTTILRMIAGFDQPDAGQIFLDGIDLSGTPPEKRPVRTVENQRATGGKVAVRIREIGSRPAANLAEQSPILSYLRAVDSHLGIRSHLDCASTDANIPMSMGIPALSIGAGGQGGGAHSTQEWFKPEGRDLGLKRVLLVLCLLLRDSQFQAAPAGPPR